jgi:AAA domain
MEITTNAKAALTVTANTGRRSLVTTERTKLSLSDFQKELIRLDEGSTESTNILVYGDSNAGKTVLAGTLPERTFWLVGEPGFKAASRWRRRNGLPPHKGARRISNTAEAWAAVEWLEHRERYRQLEWLVIDGASTMQDRFRLGYAAEAFDLKGNRAHRNLPDKPDYFNTQNFLKSWIPRFIDMQVNLLITAHAYRTNQTEDGELLVFPGFQGKTTEVANAISGLMDITGYLEARRFRNRKTGETRIDRTLWFASPTGRAREDQETRYIVGEKFGCLGESLKDPTIEKIQALIERDGE